MVKLQNCQENKMAITIFPGATCAICRKTIEKNDEYRAFNPFTNERDPLYIFHDAVVHESCYMSHPLKQEVEDYFELADSYKRIWPPLCQVCDVQIKNPDDFFYTGIVCRKKEDPLFRYNGLAVHLTCVRKWTLAEEVLAVFRKMAENEPPDDRSGIQYAISRIQKALHSD